MTLVTNELAKFDVQSAATREGVLVQQVELPPPPPPPPTATKSRRWPWVLGVVIVLAIIGSVVGDDLDTDETGDVAAPSPQQPSESVPPPSPSPEIATTTIPDVEGRPLASAQTLLERAGLGSVISERLSREREGTVLSQGLTPGGTVSEGTDVTLVVAASFPKIPRVVGDNVTNARRTMKAEGFDVRIRRETSTKRKDTVISQSPAGGTEARPGRLVMLAVAKPAPAPATTQNCTAGYSPCLPPASDYDCAGGSGDGPKYTGRVTVTGSDPYDLDSDNDGVGCE